MRSLIILILFIIFLLTFVADPAPAAIEISEVILLILPFTLGLLGLLLTDNYILRSDEINVVLAIIVYLSYLLIAALLGLINGAPYLNVLRSTGPYINFVPLLFVGLFSERRLNLLAIIIVLISVGLLQASYNLYLYFSHSSAAFNTLDVLIKRITLVDTRTTLPLVLSVAILPVIFLRPHRYLFRNICINIFVIALIICGLFASIVTLTRAIILSIIFGWLTFAALYYFQQRYLNSSSTRAIFYRLVKYTTGFILLIFFLSNIQSVELLENGLAARFYHYGDFNQTDYTNGRLYDEWLPALNAWMNSGPIGILFGIGAGHSFTVLTGEERTYVHNLCIYKLVYGGFYGLLACLWLYTSVFILLLKRSLQTKKILYIALAALLASIFFYGQLFAVHKDLAFNAILFIIMAVALHRPNIKTYQTKNQEQGG